MDYQHVCSQILKTDPKMRFAAVYNRYSEHVASETREGLSPYIPLKESGKSMVASSLRWESRKRIAKWVGEPEYAIAKYEKLKRMTVNLNEDELLLVTMEPDADDTIIIPKILKLLS